MNRLIEKNPFYLLGIVPGSDDKTIEKAGQKLLGMLRLGAKQALKYQTPLGEFERTESDIREALAELRDTERRPLHEAVYLPLDQVPVQIPSTKKPGAFSWPGAIKALGMER